MARVSSPSRNPFSVNHSAEGVEPYVSQPSLRGMRYTAPTGYRHAFERSWLVPSRPVALVLLAVAGLMFYLRSDHLLPVLMGTTVTRVQTPAPAASAANPWPGQAHWGHAANRAHPASAETFPLNFPANLPPTAAGPTAGTGAAGVHKCLQPDGTVVYQQQRDCPTLGSR